jgi:16S rRNA (uracil1498-N3)-methyltransferase
MADIPFFFEDALLKKGERLVLSDETFRHVSQALRMRQNDQLQLTNGNGYLMSCRITDVSKKSCVVECVDTAFFARPALRSIIAISLLKQVPRFEWFLEKAVEMGTTSVIPLVCERTQKTQYRMDRLRSICISAMLQSKQVWLAELSEPLAFDKLGDVGCEINLIAHCYDTPREPITTALTAADSLILIGPEGDFSPREVEDAVRKGYKPISLGDTRLRTETAGIVAASSLLLNRLR